MTEERREEVLSVGDDCVLIGANGDGRLKFSVLRWDGIDNRSSKSIDLCLGDDTTVSTRGSSIGVPALSLLSLRILVDTTISYLLPLLRLWASESAMDVRLALRSDILVVSFFPEAPRADDEIVLPVP